MKGLFSREMVGKYAAKTVIRTRRKNEKNRGKGGKENYERRKGINGIGGGGVNLKQKK